MYEANGFKETTRSFQKLNFVGGTEKYWEKQAAGAK